MAPRKSTASNADGDVTMDASTAAATASTPVAATSTPSKDTPSQHNKEKDKEKEKDKDGLGVEDLGLPKTMVQRLAKGVLPPNTQIQKDAQTAIWRSATVFVNYLASSANENAHRASKKTIQPQDVLDAIKDLEFNSFLPRLEAELTKHNADQSEKRTSYRKKVRDEGGNTAAAGGSASTPSATASKNGVERASAIAKGETSPVTSNGGSPTGGIPFGNPHAPIHNSHTTTSANGTSAINGSSTAGHADGSLLAAGGSGPNAGFDDVDVLIPPTVKVRNGVSDHKSAGSNTAGRRDGEPSSKKARRNTVGESGGDVDMNDEDEEEDEEYEEDEEEEEDEEDEEEEGEDEDEVEGEDGERGGQLHEDLLEERDPGGEIDEAVDADDSD